MRVAVFSDIHSNQEAFQAFIDHSATLNINKYVCLGDVIGYGANPNRCIKMLRGLEGTCILGNHDAAALGIPMNMKKDARQAISWTRRRLSEESFNFLKEMTDTVKWDDILFCHSNPYRPRNWYYVAEKQYITRSFARSKAKLLFLGHTHVPVAITRRNFFCVYIRSPKNKAVFPVAELNRQIFNCGSIGQPRDGDFRISYLILDTDNRVVEFYRVEYDCKKAGEKILAAGLPEIFAQRLINGM